MSKLKNCSPLTLIMTCITLALACTILSFHGHKYIATLYSDNTVTCILFACYWFNFWYVGANHLKKFHKKDLD
jgi:hypothetical protein